MGAPHTTLTGTRWGPSHEKLGDVMPTCFRPHLNSPQQPCSDDFVDASSVIWCVCATMLCSAVMWWKSTFARQMQSSAEACKAAAVRTDSHLKAAHQGVCSDNLRVKEVVLAKA